MKKVYVEGLESIKVEMNEEKEMKKEAAVEEEFIILDRVTLIKLALAWLALTMLVSGIVTLYLKMTKGSLFAYVTLALLYIGLSAWGLYKDGEIRRKKKVEEVRE